MTSVRRAVLLLAAALATSCTAPPAALDVVAIAVQHEVATLDPHREDTLASFVVHSNIYDALVDTDASMQVVPALSDRWETPDPTTWLFHIRPGVTFHSGRALQAADVVATYRRLLDSPQLQMRAYVADVAEVRAVDPSTVLLRTHQQSSIFLNGLSRVLIVPAGSANLAGAADGTGAYALARWDPRVSVELKRNDRYWGPRPRLARVQLDLGRTPEQAADGLQRGAYQMAQCNSRQALQRIAADPRFRVRRNDSLYVKYLGVDIGRANTPFVAGRPNPFRDLRVRRALHLALGRQQLVAGLTTDAVPATQPVPRFVFGFDPTIGAPPHDLAAARALLKEAGVEDGFDVVMHARRVVEGATAVQQALAAVGVRIRVEPLGDDEFYRVAGAGGSSMWLSRYGCQSGDASEILLSMVHSRDPQRGLGWNNWQDWSDPAMDREIQRSARIQNPAERGEALRTIMRQVMDQLVLIPLYNDQDAYVVSRDLDWTPRNDSLIRAADIR